MRTTMPEGIRNLRIATTADAPVGDVRTDLSVAIGLDVDLALGEEHLVPDDMSEQDRTDALFEAFTAEYARVEALADMIETGFVDLPQVSARLAHVVAELELADDALGYEDEADEEELGGIAA